MRWLFLTSACAQSVHIAGLWRNHICDPFNTQIPDLATRHQPLTTVTRRRPHRKQFDMVPHLPLTTGTPARCSTWCCKHDISEEEWGRKPEDDIAACTAPGKGRSSGRGGGVVGWWVLTDGKLPIPARFFSKH